MSDSSSPDQEMTLLHMAMLMSVNESRMGRNKNKLVVYPKDKLSASAVAKKWNRVKIRCVQKYNQDAQFGLRALSIFTDSRDPSSTGMPLDIRTASSPGLLSPSQAQASNSLTTPKQEKQSRLFHDCMKGKVKDSDDKVSSNCILERIAAEREKYSPSYQRKKLLKRELPKAEVIKDFIDSYKKRELSAELTGASRKLSSHGKAYSNHCSKPVICS